jgi:ubiquinone/menaquinone biosynthesis C-methylase UbiE
VRRLYRELSLRDKYPLIKYSYVLADLEKRLPFNDAYFDKVCCNLVLSYVSDPLSSLKELCRVVKPGGKIIVTSLKPYADLSHIYRNFADMTENEEELKEARKLLSAAGRIKQKEDAGIYTFFFEEELKKLLQNIGISILTVKRTFGGQANLISGRKE